MFASPLAMSHDILNENEATRRILLNKEIIAINQDALGNVARRINYPGTCRIYLRKLSGNRQALAIMNPSDKPQRLQFPLSIIGKEAQYTLKDVWENTTTRPLKTWKVRFSPMKLRFSLLKHPK